MNRSIKRAAALTCVVAATLTQACTSTDTTTTESHGSPTSEPVTSAPRSAEPSASAVPTGRPRLDWRLVADVPVATRVHAASLSRVALQRSETRVDIVTGSGSSGLGVQHRSRSGYRVNDVFFDGPWALVVDSHSAEAKPDRATVYDLRRGTERSLSSGTTPTPEIGAWDMGDGKIAYNTRNARGEFCIAVADVRSLRGEVIDCVGRRHGISQPKLSAAGVGYTTFDDQRPLSCLAPQVWSDESGKSNRVRGVRPCRGWEVVPAGPTTAVWSVIERPQEIERGSIHARMSGGSVEELGAGVAGSLTWCGEHVWFSRNGDDREGGLILRWSPRTGLQQVLRVPYRRGVLSEPACSGDAVAVTVLGKSTRVWAVTVADR